MKNVPSAPASLATTERQRAVTVAAPAGGGGESPLLGHSPAMERVYSLIERAAPTDANVLILGENGTGKELVARELHRRSRRADNIMVSVDLGAIAESLFDSELFGHVKGAFTDAKADRIGRMQAASEVDDLALRRLKKRKLMLKDWIAKLESLLIPDAPA